MKKDMIDSDIVYVFIFINPRTKDYKRFFYLVNAYVLYHFIHLRMEIIYSPPWPRIPAMQNAAQISQAIILQRAKKLFFFR